MSMPKYRQGNATLPHEEKLNLLRTYWCDKIAVNTFCQTHQISKSTLYRWLKDHRLELMHILLSDGFYLEGFELYSMIFGEAHIDKIDWHAAEGKTITICSPTGAGGGLGDVIQLTRFIRELKRFHLRIIFKINKKNKPLKELLEQTDYIDVITDRNVSTDYHVSIANLPFLLRTTPKSIPTKQYLYAASPDIEKYRKTLAGDKKFKVGVKWTVGPNFNRTFRAISYEHVKQLMCDEVSLYSLEIENNGNLLSTAAKMTNLNLIISVDTSILHLAGAMHLPVWGLIPYQSGWRFNLKNKRMPWYPTMELFRQTEDGIWDVVIETVRSELRKRYL